MNQHKITIAKALSEGVNTARRLTDELRIELRTDISDERRKEIVAEIALYDDWIIELAEALHWLNDLANPRRLPHAG